MADPSLYKYSSPLENYRDLPPLPEEISADGKSYVNPATGKLSSSYDQFIDPLDKGRRGAL